MPIKPYQQTVEEVVDSYSTDPERGLTKQEVEQRTKQYGTNNLPDKPGASIFYVFMSQFQNPLIYILLAAASIIFFLGNYLDAAIISGVLFFNAIIGTIQEGRTRTILESLRRYLVTNAVVIRNGIQHIVPAEQLTVGDLIILQEGEKVPADARITQEHNLQINESALTGESTPVEKNTAAITTTVPIHDQQNMAFKGTFVVAGFAYAIVTNIGKTTHIGQLQQTVEEIQTDTPLKKAIDHLSHQILFFILGICIFLFGYGLWIGKAFNELLVMLTALFICVIPEGLPVVFTLALVSGAWRMAQHSVLVKRLQAVEGLGRITVALIDKTGTLTRNEMVVSEVVTTHGTYTVEGEGYYPEGALFHNQKKIDLAYDSSLEHIAQASALLSHAQIDFIKEVNLFAVKGDPTEAALSVFAEKNKITKEHLLKTHTLINEIPFESETRYQVALYRHDNEYVAYINGAPEAILQASGAHSHMEEQLAKLLKNGLRVVGLAMKTFPLQAFDENKVDEKVLRSILDGKLSFLGLVGIQDSIRPDVAKSITDAHKAGIKVVMVTGDHKDTALFVAQRVGITQNSRNVLHGKELAEMSDTQLKNILPSIDVCARVTPHQKLRIVKMYQQIGDIVAMTGDGVNDAPSLVAADIGIAMGNIGTEVAKQAADIILLDDSFTNIMDGVQEGRNIYFVLRRVILYFFTTNLGEVLVVLFALLANLPLPILAAQILWLNLITDGFLDVALSMEPQEPNLLSKKIKPGSQFIDKAILAKMLYMSIPMGIGSLAVFYVYYKQDITLARTMCLVTMAAFQWFNAWNCRSETQSVFSLGFFSNKWLILATSFVLGLQIFILHNSYMQFVFKSVPLTVQQWGLVIAVAFPIFIIEEVRKYIFKTVFKQRI